jgi:hypothetical protein
MCYILCTTSLVSATLHRVHRGFAGVGEISPEGSGATPPRIFFLGKCVTFLPHFSCHLDFRVHCWVVFRHMVFADGFLFSVKELGLLTNPGHWVRVLDVIGSYMYIVL